MGHEKTCGRCAHLTKMRTTTTGFFQELYFRRTEYLARFRFPLIAETSVEQLGGQLSRTQAHELA